MLHRLNRILPHLLVRMSLPGHPLAALSTSTNVSAGVVAGTGGRSASGGAVGDLLSHVPLAPLDPILGTKVLFDKDDAKNKVNLGIGAYRDDQGKPQVLECVKRVSEGKGIHGTICQSRLMTARNSCRQRSCCSMTPR